MYIGENVEFGYQRNRKCVYMQWRGNFKRGIINLLYIVLASNLIDDDERVVDPDDITTTS